MSSNHVLRSPALRTASSFAWTWIWPPLVLATALLGGLASQGAAPLYEALERPDWAPPAWLFGPVWLLLYALMAIASTWVARSPASHDDGARRLGLWLFGLALIPNALWSWCFFAWQRADWAMASMLLLLGLLGTAIGCFGRVQRGAAWMLLPLLAWLSFAAVLNADLLLRNGPVL